MSDSAASTTVEPDAASTTVEPDAADQQPEGKSGLWRPALLVAGLVLLGLWKGWLLVVVIVALIAMIFLHELGHYLTARWAGIQVTHFFLGFGPTLWSTRRGETEVGIKAIPAGAFVKVPGMTREEEVDAATEPRTYRQAPWHKRVIFAAAGSTMHFLLALSLLVAHGLFVGDADPDRLLARGVYEGSSADLAGVRAGDRIVSVNGTRIDARHSLGEAVAPLAGRTVPVVVERNGTRTTLTATLGTRTSLIGTVREDIGVFFTPTGPQLALQPHGRAVEAGLADGDRIVTINRTPVRAQADLDTVVRNAAEGNLVFAVTRGENRAPVAATVDLGSSVEVTRPAGQIGIATDYATVRAAPLTAVKDAGVAFWDYTRMSVEGMATALNPVNLLGLFKRAATTGPVRSDPVTKPTPAAAVMAEEEARNSTRPISLVGSVGLATDLARDDWGRLFLILATLNISIGLLNLIPLLPFDGGHIAIACYEKVRELLRRDGTRYLVNPAKVYPVAVAVVAVLGLLFVSSLYLDLVDPIRLG